ncbi:hypothetical protein DI291_0680 [Bacillus paralicheniformis]|nr:hypothetical protein DI291_0680 [Bacillus paralicheniformis]
MPKENHNAKPPKTASGAFLNCCFKKAFSPDREVPFLPGYDSLINQKTYKLIKIKQIPPLFPLFFALI